MTHGRDDSAIFTAMEQIIENGLEGLDVAVSILINEAMRIERSRALEADPWQRTETRKGYQTQDRYQPRGQTGASDTAGARADPLLPFRPGKRASQ